MESQGGPSGPLSRPLGDFPSVIGPWRMVREGVIEQEEKDVLRADDYLTRQYSASPDKIAGLFVAYFRSQRAGQTPHSPKNCLPGSGWTWTVSDTIRVDIAGRAQAHRDQSLYRVERRRSRRRFVLVSVARSCGSQRISRRDFHRLGRAAVQPDRYGASTRRHAGGRKRRGVHPGVFHPTTPLQSI